MKWASTGRSSPPVPFIDALFAGTAPDGGLYFPDHFDPLSPSSLEALRSADLVETASIVGGHLLRGGETFLVQHSEVLVGDNSIPGFIGVQPIGI